MACYVNPVPTFNLTQHLSPTNFRPAKATTPHAENAIRSVKVLIRMAVQYVLRDSTHQILGFTTISILKLWGELFNWAITVLDMRMSPHDPKKTRHAVLTDSIPNIQEIRMLPIFSVLLVRRNENATGNQIDLSINMDIILGHR